MKKANNDQHISDQPVNRNMPSEKGEGAKHQTRQAERFPDKNLDQGTTGQRSRNDDVTEEADDRNRP